MQLITGAIVLISCTLENNGLNNPLTFKHSINIVDLAQRQLQLFQIDCVRPKIHMVEGKKDIIVCTYNFIFIS